MWNKVCILQIQTQSKDSLSCNSYFIFSAVLTTLPSAMKQEKETKSIQDVKEAKFCLLMRWLIWIILKHHSCNRKCWKQSSDSKVSGHKVSTEPMLPYLSVINIWKFSKLLYCAKNDTHMQISRNMCMRFLCSKLQSEQDQEKSR